MQQNVPAAVTGCIQDYSWCSIAVGAVTGWASAPYLVTDAGGNPTNLQVSGAQLGIPIVVPTGVGAVVATPAGWRDGPGGTSCNRGRAGLAGRGSSFLRNATGCSAGPRRWRSDGWRNAAGGGPSLSYPCIALRLFLRQRPTGCGRANGETDRLRGQVEMARPTPRTMGGAMTRRLNFAAFDVLARDCRCRRRSLRRRSPPPPSMPERQIDRRDVLCQFRRPQAQR